MAALAQPPRHPRRHFTSPSHPPPLPLPATRLRRAGGGRSEKPTCVNLAALWAEPTWPKAERKRFTVQPARALPSPGRLPLSRPFPRETLRTLIMTDPNFRAISAILPHDDPHFHHDGAVFPGVSSGEPTAAPPPSPRSRRAPPSRRGARPGPRPLPDNARRRSRGRRGRARAGSRRTRRRRARTR
jgi:hypothetical protein